MILRETGPGVIEIDTPAKLNLFLEIKGKRKDGFHDLETLMHSVALYDTVRIETRKDGIRFACRGGDAGPDGDNLAFRAAKLFLGEGRRRAGGRGCFPGGAAVRLEKRIPAGSGLGGGSSDAAAVLSGLNELSGRPLDAGDLAALGGTLGSDVPFFFSGGTARCTGRGEEVRPIPGIGPFLFAILFPGFPLATKRVYENLNLCLTSDKRNNNDLVERLRFRRLEGVNEAFYNDLQESAFKTSPPLREVWKKLKDDGPGIFTLTGSGSCLFRLIEKPDEGPKVPDAFRRKKNWSVFIVPSSPPTGSSFPKEDERDGDHRSPYQADEQQG